MLTENLNKFNLNLITTEKIIFSIPLGWYMMVHIIIKETLLWPIIIIIIIIIINQTLLLHILIIIKQTYYCVIYQCLFLELCIRLMLLNKKNQSCRFSYFARIITITVCIS